MKYAHIDENNKVLGWYTPDVHGIYVPSSDSDVEGYWDMSNIPTPNIEVTDEVWQEAININANCYEDGEFSVKDFRTSEEIREEELQQQIAEAKAYLASTDFYMTVDKYTELDEVRKVELTTKRAEARELINTLEAELITLQGAI